MLTLMRGPDKRTKDIRKLRGALARILRAAKGLEDERTGKGTIDHFNAAKPPTRPQRPMHEKC